MAGQAPGAARPAVAERKGMQQYLKKGGAKELPSALDDGFCGCRWSVVRQWRRPHSESVGTEQ